MVSVWREDQVWDKPCKRGHAHRTLVAIVVQAWQATFLVKNDQRPLQDRLVMNIANAGTLASDLEWPWQMIFAPYERAEGSRSLPSAHTRPVHNHHAEAYRQLERLNRGGQTATTLHHQTKRIPLMPSAMAGTSS